MNKKEKNEELQSRRGFFKKAAKGALPILGLIALTSMPLNASAGTHESHREKACFSSCSGSCDGCKGCSGACKDDCENCCKGCENSCKGVCGGRQCN